MIEQAKVLLNQELEKEPKDAELHFILGQCLLATGDLNNAQEEFGRATRLESDFGGRIGQAYLARGKEQFQKSEFETARPLLANAAQYDPALKPVIANLYADAAVGFIQAGDLDSATRMGSEASLFDASSSGKVAAAALAKGRELVMVVQNWQNVLQLASLGTTFDTHGGPDWGALLLDLLGRGRTTLPYPQLISIGEACVPDGAWFSPQGSRFLFRFRPGRTR
jgi:tetratricopeptide (TPR) repeat protein